jgi:hypothetical protein
MVPKLEIEPQSPRCGRFFALGNLSHSAVSLWNPATAHLTGSARGISIESTEHHRAAGIELALNVEDLAPIRDPRLTPAPGRGIVQTEALAPMPVGSVVFLEQHAIVENEAHPRSRDAASGIPALEHIPVSDPEIELPVLGRCASF